MTETLSWIGGLSRFYNYDSWDHLAQWFHHCFVIFALIFFYVFLDYLDALLLKNYFFNIFLNKNILKIIRIKYLLLRRRIINVFIVVCLVWASLATLDLLNSNYAKLEAFNHNWNLFFLLVLQSPVSCM